MHGIIGAHFSVQCELCIEIGRRLIDLGLENCQFAFEGALRVGGSGCGQMLLSSSAQNVSSKPVDLVLRIEARGDTVHNRPVFCYPDLQSELNKCPATPSPPLPKSPPTWAAELTPRERRFVEEYLVDLNGTEAAIRAGLGKTRKSSTEIASRMKRKATVAAAIAQLLAERGNVTGSRVVEEIGRVAFAKMTDFARVEDGRLIITDTRQLTEDQQAAIQEISETVGEHGRTIKVKLHPKMDALDKLAKVLSMYRERVEVSGTVNHDHEHTLTDVRARIAERLKGISENLKAIPLVEIDLPPRRVALPVAPKMGRTIDAD